MDLVADLARYQADRAKNIYLTSTHGMGEVMERNKLDALVIPGNSGANVAALPGPSHRCRPVRSDPERADQPAVSSEDSMRAGDVRRQVHEHAL